MENQPIEWEFAAWLEWADGFAKALAPFRKGYPRFKINE